MAPFSHFHSFCGAAIVFVCDLFASVLVRNCEEKELNGEEKCSFVCTTWCELSEHERVANQK